MGIRIFNVTFSLVNIEVALCYFYVNMKLIVTIILIIATIIRAKTPTS